MQHNATAAALSSSCLLNHASNSPELNPLITLQDLQQCMSRESKRLKKSSSDWLNSGNVLIQHLSEKAIFVFSCFAS